MSVMASRFLLLLTFVISTLSCKDAVKRPEIFSEFINNPNRFRVQFSGSRNSRNLKVKNDFDIPWKPFDEGSSFGDTEIYIGRLEIIDGNADYLIRIYGYNKRQWLIRLVGEDDVSIYARKDFIFR